MADIRVCNAFPCSIKQELSSSRNYLTEIVTLDAIIIGLLTNISNGGAHGNQDGRDDQVNTECTSDEDEDHEAKRIVPAPCSLNLRLAWRHIHLQTFYALAVQKRQTQNFPSQA